MNYVCASVAGLAFFTSAAFAGPLHDAARDGDVKRVTLLLDQGTDITEPDTAGEPALLVASLAGRPDVVALLLDRGCDIEIRNKGGLTALHAAAYGGNLDTVKLLLAKGADVKPKRVAMALTVSGLSGCVNACRTARRRCSRNHCKGDCPHSSWNKACRRLTDRPQWLATMATGNRSPRCSSM